MNYKTNKKRMANLIKNPKMLVIAAAVIGCVALGVAFFFGDALYGTYCDKEEHVIFIEPNESADSVKIKVEGVAKGDKLEMFRWLAEKKDYYNHIRPGRYDIGSGASTLTVFRNLRNGSETPAKLTIPPLRTVGDLARHLGKKLMADSATFAAVLTDSTLLAEHGLKRETAVCLFLQNTYEVYWSIKPEKLMERMAKEYDAFWTRKREGKLDDIMAGFTREQAITLASIVESETANNAEKPSVAGLYINRLKKGIKLQADPTVKFAVGDFTIHRVLNRHLATVSPYNTYLNEGLPPGPICIPSVESIDAVLNYEHNDYIFMCAKEDFSGTHNFARTDAEHQANARRYQKALDERNIKK